MAQISIGDSTKSKLTELRQKHRDTAGPDNLSYDQFLQIMMTYWEQKNV
jgi:hypothetical protein